MQIGTLPSTWHSESFLNIPLVRQMLSDKALDFVPRSIDKAWYQDRVVPISVSGFNPLNSEIYFGTKSPFAHWLKDPTASARDINEGDFAFREVLFAVHDYLHIWAYRLIVTLCPELGLGSAKIQAQNFEALSFAHLLTEAVATVGLDYWYLCQLSIDGVLQIGTTVEALTVSYHQRYAAEYRRMDPSFQVNSPDFFRRIATFYCTGVYDGFDLNDLRRSPRLYSWLNHELSYGELQRVYTREWLAYLSEESLALSAEELKRPVAVTEPWQHELIQEIGNRLWAKISLGVDSLPQFKLKGTWASSERKPLDLRFVNLDALDEQELGALTERDLGEQNFRYWFFQWLSSFDYELFDQDLIPIVKKLSEARDIKMLQRLTQEQPRLLADLSPRRDLFILN